MMATHLHECLFTSLTLEQCVVNAREADIDGDGVISEDDLRAFVSRCTYFNHGTK
jgi:hypothetical protein